MYWGNPQHGGNLQIRSAGRWVRWRHLLKPQEGTDAWGEWVTVLPRVVLARCVRNMGRNAWWNKGHAMESDSSWMLPSFLGFDESLGRKETAFLLFLNFIAIAAVAAFIQKKPSSVRWRSFGENSSLGLERRRGDQQALH